MLSQSSRFTSRHDLTVAGIGQRNGNSALLVCRLTPCPVVVNARRRIGGDKHIFLIDRNHATIDHGAFSVWICLDSHGLIAMCHGQLEFVHDLAAQAELRPADADPE